ncbi:MAG: hypothetical protein JSV80_18435 [Acidobacteriota bacterium]|nr:MAG: hypothetical protein JSV80_18435 [Acidobacteriota bacterium]
MKRTRWLDDDDTPDLQLHVEQLRHFTEALADGTVDAEELNRQREALVAAMKSVESELTDEQHVKVTKLLTELTAYNIMETLHSLAVERVRRAVDR